MERGDDESDNEEEDVDLNDRYQEASTPTDASATTSVTMFS